MKGSLECPICAGSILLFDQIQPNSVLPWNFKRSDIPKEHRPDEGVCLYCGQMFRPTDKTNEELMEQIRKLRAEFRFDEALGICNSVLRQNAHDGKANWLCALCRQKVCGDVGSGAKLTFFGVPSVEKIVEDENYKLALEWTYDNTVKKEYQRQAAELDALRERICTLRKESAGQTNCQVFLCVGTGMALTAQELEQVLKQRELQVFRTDSSSDEGQIHLARNDAKVMIVLSESAASLQQAELKSSWSAFGRKWQSNNDARMIALTPTEPCALDPLFSSPQSISTTQTGWKDQVLKIVQTVYPPIKTTEKTVIINQVGGDVQENIEHAFSAFMKHDFKNAMLSAEKVLQAQNDCVPARYILAFYQTCVQNTSHREALKVFFAEQEKKTLSAEDIKLIKNMFLASGTHLSAYESAALRIVLQAEDTDANVCAFADLFCPKLIAKQTSVDYFTPELQSVYTELATRCSVPKTCYALLAAVNTNPDSPVPQDDFYLKSKAKAFHDRYFLPVGNIINSMKDGNLRGKFRSAYQNELTKFERKMLG